MDISELQPSAHVPTSILSHTTSSVLYGPTIDGELSKGYDYVERRMFNIQGLPQYKKYIYVTHQTSKSNAVE